MHGGGHGGWCYQKVARRLQEAGHTVYLRDVILVGHSYGGMVITGVADRAADRVGRIVYLDAANPRNGQSLVDVAGPYILMDEYRQAGRLRDIDTGHELMITEPEAVTDILVEIAES